MLTQPGGDETRVAVVVPTLNEARHIEKVLHEIIQDDPIASTCPVLVIDGGSEDGTQDIVRRLTRRFSNLRLIHNPHQTQAAALNMMLAPEFDQIEVLVRCDAHARYPERFVSQLVTCLNDRNAASVVIPMDAVAEAGCFQQGLAWVADTALGAGGSAHRGGTRSGYVDHGHHAAFRMSMFRALCGYNTRYVANEDAEYDHRVTDAGGRIWLASNIRIGYFPRSSPQRLWMQYFRYGFGRAQTCLQHRARPKLRQLAPVLHVFLLALSAALLPITSIGLLWPLVYGIVLGIAAIYLAARHKSFCGLTAAPAVAIMHLAWGTGFIARLLSPVDRVRTSLSGQT